MAPYKLYFFNLKSNVEPIRFLFKYGNIEFEDIRIQQKDWPTLKKKFFFEKLPVLTHEDKEFHQTIAICRYVAKLVNLVGKNDWENLEIDSVVDTILELRQKTVNVHLVEDDEEREILIEQHDNETMPFYLERFEALVKKNNGFLALGRLTWADLYFASLAPLFIEKLSIGLEKYPLLQTLKMRVEQIPSIKEWIETRPYTKY